MSAALHAAHTIDDATLDKLLDEELQKLNQLHDFDKATRALLREGTHHVTHVLVVH